MILKIDLYLIIGVPIKNCLGDNVRSDLFRLISYLTRKMQVGLARPVLKMWIEKSSLSDISFEF